jgi:hypothetical protein
MKEKIGTIKPTKFSTVLVIIPADIAKDSTFPFNPPEKVNIRIEDRRLIIEKVQKDTENT